MKYLLRKKRKGRRCRSYYHNHFVRNAIMIFGIFVFLLGFAFALGVNVFRYIPNTNVYFNLIIGFIYMLAGSFIIHFTFDYFRLKREIPLICHHCGEEIFEENCD